jgi:hypothetical protein
MILNLSYRIYLVQFKDPKSNIIQFLAELDLACDITASNQFIIITKY